MKTAPRPGLAPDIPAPCARRRFSRRGLDAYRGAGGRILRPSFLIAYSPPLMICTRQRAAIRPADHRQTARKHRRRKASGLFLPSLRYGENTANGQKRVFSRGLASACFPECLRLSGCLPHALPCLTFSGLIDPRRAVLVHALHLYSLRPIPSARYDLPCMMQGGTYQTGGARPPGCTVRAVSSPCFLYLSSCHTGRPSAPGVRPPLLCVGLAGFRGLYARGCV